MKQHLVLAVTVFVTAAVTPAVAQDTTPQPLGIPEFVNRGLMSRVSAFAEVCGNQVPTTKETWEHAVADVSARIDVITRELMATAPFTELAHEVIPAEGAPDLLKAVADSKQELLAQLKKQEPEKNCPQYLANIQHYSDEFLRAGVTQSLAGIQTLLVGLKQGYYK